MQIVLRFEAGYEAAAERLAKSLQLSLLPSDALAPADTAFELFMGGEGLSLRELFAPSDKASPRKKKEPPPSDIRCDFVAGELKHRRLYGGGKGQMIVKAVGLNKYKSSVLDLTAGLGRDSYVLANAGARVIMIERHPVVAALLADGLQRLVEQGDAQELAIAKRLSLRSGDSQSYLAALAEAQYPDVIYLDPMFPERGKTAKVKKAMAFFHHLVGADVDADILLTLALEKARYRVVVKRPRHAPPLADMQPSLCFEGKSTRFDIYPLKKLPG